MDWLDTTVFGAPYVDKFIEKKVDGHKLATLDLEQLENEYGISNKLHRLRFKRVIDQLREPPESVLGSRNSSTKVEVLDPSEVPRWNKHQVFSWLQNLSFGAAYSGNFMTYGVDGKSLIQLDDQSLEEELSVDKALVRKRYLRAIKELSPTGSWDDILGENLQIGSDSDIVHKSRHSKKRSRSRGKPRSFNSVSLSSSEGLTFRFMIGIIHKCVIG
eukprot:TRINITY_DN7232_c0_g1_i1.p1 TRINITY_DN7232_c0_g1~~TRINITY_DN7232_c0_g1_i1.p1  ORF type:complete len:216 (-),score=35.58 TRINITY_DN7232_c0_g1_i1:175-822(-)